MKLHGREVKEGDRLFDLKYGWLNVAYVNSSCLKVFEEADSPEDTFGLNINGKLPSGIPRLYWSKPEIFHTVPKRKITKYRWAYQLEGNQCITADYYATEKHARRILSSPVKWIFRLDPSAKEFEE